MAKTHKVIAGDTLNKIAVRYYGDAAKWTDIVKSNPQLAGRKSVYDGSPVIYPGDVLIIPDDSVQAVAKTAVKETVVLDDNAPRDLGLKGLGKFITGFTGFTLVRSVFGNDGFSFSSTWNENSEQTRNAFRPFSYPTFDVYFDDDLVFTGKAMPPTPSVQPASQTINVQGYPLCGVLVDSCLPPSLFPAEYSGLDLKQIAETVCEPFGIGVVVQGSVGAAFEKVEVGLDDKVWDFLSKLAEQRNMFLTNTVDGNLLIYSPEVEAVSATFKQGEVPFISCAPEFDGQKMYSHITGYTKTSKTADSQKYTYENKLLINKGVLRCYSKQIDDAVEGTLEESVKALAGKMFAKCVKYKLTVSGHRDKTGRLYRENMAVSVKAPGAEIYRETKLLADEVTLTRDDRGGKQTTFTLVLPESRTGALPEVFPWEE